MKKIRPIKSNVVIRLKQRDAVSKGGIHIPEGAREAESWGEVMGVGSEVTEVEVGEVVCVRETSGTKYTEGGFEFVLAPERSILCKIVGESGRSVVEELAGH